MKRYLLAFILSIFLTSSAFGQPGGWISPPSIPIRVPDCSTYTNQGQLCYDTDDNKLYVGNGTTAVESPLGNLTLITDGATGDVTAVQLRGQTHKVTGAYTLSLATAAAGMNACFFASTAAVFSLDLTTGTDVFILTGSSLTAGNKIVSDGTLGAKICVEATEAGFYRATPILGIWADGGA